jgi:hypothetical protein
METKNTLVPSRRPSHRLGLAAPRSGLLAELAALVPWSFSDNRHD